MEFKEIKTLFKADVIAERIKELAKEIDADYGDVPLVLVCVLKGAFVFHADLARALKKPLVEVDFMRISSYGNDTKSLKKITVTKTVEVSLKNKHVLLVEDIIDTGHSMLFLKNMFANSDALSFKSVVLLDKKERREVNIHVDYAAFTVAEGFLVGYGLDYMELYRNIPDVCVVVPQ